MQGLSDLMWRVSKNNITNAAPFMRIQIIMPVLIFLPYVAIALEHVWPAETVSQNTHKVQEEIVRSIPYESLSAFRQCIWAFDAKVALLISKDGQHVHFLFEYQPQSAFLSKLPGSDKWGISPGFTRTLNGRNMRIVRAEYVHIKDAKYIFNLRDEDNRSDFGLFVTPGIPSRNEPYEVGYIESSK